MLTSRLARWVWHRLPPDWLGDLQDPRVRSAVAKTIFQNQLFSVFVHLLLCLAYYLSHPLMTDSISLQALLLLFLSLAIERVRVHHSLPATELSAQRSIDYLLLGVLYSSLTALILAILAVTFLLISPAGFNSPTPLGILLYYFGAIIKNISVRLTVIIYSAVVLTPMAVCFLIKQELPDLLIAALLMTLGITMVMFAKTMEGIITSRIRQSAELEYLTQQLTQERDRANSASQSKTKFLATASHDLRQPVHAIGLYLASLMQKPVPTEPGHAIDGIYQSWAALDGLLAQILELSQAENQPGTQRLQAVALTPLLNQLVRQFAMHAHHKNQRIVLLDRTDAQVLADPTLLQRVLSNLLDNALKYAPANTTVAVAVRPRTGHWLIQVRDAGHGIAEHDRERVFDIFEQAGNQERNRQAGYGIGLAIAKSLVEAQGGRLEMRSAVGCGTSMGVVLSQAPAAPPEPQAPEPPRAERAPPAPPGRWPARADLPLPLPSLQLDAGVRRRILASGKHILLLEDDPLVRHAFTEVFAVLDLPLHCVDQAAEALQGVGETLLAICDMRLPGPMTGLQVAQRLQAQGIPALVITGESLTECRQALYDAGVPGMQKPVKPQHILDWIATVA